MLLPALVLIASIAAPVASPCMADDSDVAIRGVVKEVNNRDRRTGQPYSYFIVDSSETYCLFGQDVDERSSTPTRAVTLIPHAYDKSANEFRRYVGRTVTITGKLSFSNGGGPQLIYTAISKPPE